MRFSRMQIAGRRRLSALLLAIVSSFAIGSWLVVPAGVIVGAVVASAPPALAATASDRGPSAAVDQFDNQFVFWKGTNGDLWETFYDATSGDWSRAIYLGMGPLGSEPTVVVTNQVFSGSGGHHFNGQFVYWRGTNSDLWFAYWAGNPGTWHGPIESGFGPGAVCSQPSAAFSNPLNGVSPGPRIWVFWKGYGPNGNCSSGNYLYNLMYADSETFPPNDSGDLLGPYYDSGAGSIGSSPSATGVRSVCIPQNFGSINCLKWVVVAWQGNDGYLWTQVWNTVNGDVSGGTEDTRAGILGSPPSVGSEVLPISGSGPLDSWEPVWRGTDGNLWYAHPNVANIDVGPIYLGDGQLGSAPTIAEGEHGGPPPIDFHDYYIFWKGGGAGNLWEAFYNGHSGDWHLYSYDVGPL